MAGVSSIHPSINGFGRDKMSTPSVLNLSSPVNVFGVRVVLTEV